MHLDVEFPHGLWCIKVAAPDAAVHADEFCLACDLRLPCQRSGNVGQRTNANQCDFVIGLHDGVADCAHPVVVHGAGILVEVVVAQPSFMGVRIVVQRNANADGNMRAVHHLEDLSHQTGAINGIAGAGGDEFDVELRASKQEGKGPNIIDIVTDVGIQNGGYCHAL